VKSNPSQNALLPPSSEIKTGTDALKQALRVRLKKGHQARLSRDLNVAMMSLGEFAFGDALLPVDVMRALARELWEGHAEYDAEADMLHSASTAPWKSLGVHPPAAIAGKKYPVGTVAAFPRAEVPVTPQPMRPRRAGWID
jgi:hypothetical protein